MDESRTLVDCLRNAQARFPDNAAIVYKDVKLTYRELWLRASALAREFRSRGVSPGARVALLVENSPEYVIGYYAVWLAGGIAVGLNTALRAPELVRNIEHCSPALLLAQGSHPELAAIAVAECVPQIFVIGQSAVDIVTRAKVTAMDLSATLAADAGFFAAPEASAPASIIYTSGTTGDPKGVTLTHRNLFANMHSIVEYLGLSERDSIVNVLPFFYSYGSSVLHAHLAVGGTVYIENSMSYPHLIVEKMAEVRASGFAGVPSTFALLLQRVNLSHYALPALRYVTQAGGAMRTDLITKLRAALPQANIFIMYGQTEATARITYLAPEFLETKLGSVGKAIPGVTLEVRSESGASAEVNLVGEVWVKGDNVMRGYWSDAIASEQVLRGGWLKTGDMGYLDGDGFLFLQGRRSDMIKSGAHRIHPKEIEDAIAELSEVAESAVIGVDDEILGQAIKAVVVPAAGAVLAPVQVQAHCKRRLASYKVPKIVVLVSALPKTASGKVRKAELLRGEPN